MWHHVHEAALLLQLRSSPWLLSAASLTRPCCLHIASSIAQLPCAVGSCKQAPLHARIALSLYTSQQPAPTDSFSCSSQCCQHAADTRAARVQQQQANHPACGKSLNICPWPLVTSKVDHSPGKRNTACQPSASAVLSKDPCALICLHPPL